MSQLQIDECFTRKTFIEEHREAHRQMYEDIKLFSEHVDKILPDCREKSAAFTKLQEALFFLGAAFSKHEAYIESPPK